MIMHVICLFTNRTCFNTENVPCATDGHRVASWLTLMSLCFHPYILVAFHPDPWDVLAERMLYYCALALITSVIVRFLHIFITVYSRKRMFRKARRMSAIGIRYNAFRCYANESMENKLPPRQNVIIMAYMHGKTPFLILIESLGGKKRWRSHTYLRPNTCLDTSVHSSAATAAFQAHTFCDAIEKWEKKDDREREREKKASTTTRKLRMRFH